MTAGGVTGGSDSGSRYVLLTRVGDPATANILAARLQSEGIDVRVHSEALGPYPVTVGQIAETQLWVAQDRVEEAATIALDAEVTNVLEGQPIARTPARVKVLAFAIAAIVALLWVLRIVAVY